MNFLEVPKALRADPLMSQMEKTRMTASLRMWAICLTGLLFLDAGCADQKHLDAGATTMFILENDSGELRCGIDFQGEHFNVVETRNGSNQIVVALEDSCWDAPTEYGLNATDCVPADLLDPETVDAVPAPVSCDSVTAATELPGPWTSAGAFCIQQEANAGAGANQHRITVVDPTDNTVQWTYQQTAEMQIIGADSKNLYLLDSVPFALKISSGQLNWIGDELYPASAGELIGENLIFHRPLYPSPCADTN